MAHHYRIYTAPQVSSALAWWVGLYADFFPGPLYQGFVEAHASFFVDNFAYEPVGKAGQRGEMFALFRDEILPAALAAEEPGGDSEGGVSTNARHVNRVKRNNGTARQRSIPGWEMLNDSEGRGATACDVTCPLDNTPLCVGATRRDCTGDEPTMRVENGRRKRRETVKLEQFVVKYRKVSGQRR